MKIAHVLNAYLPLQVAGTEVYVAALVRELKRLDCTSIIIIPNFNQTAETTYFFEGIKIIQYPEPTIASRDIIMGKKLPVGINDFLKVLKNEMPDVVHFHELSGSTGVGLAHVQKTKQLGYKTIVTFHLTKYTCRTGTLMYMNKTKCSGVIREIACSKCLLNNMGVVGAKAMLISKLFQLMNLLNIDTRFINNGLGTALSFPKIIAEMKNDLIKLKNSTDKFIILNEWYKNILLKNGFENNKLKVINYSIPNVASLPSSIEKVSTKLSIIFVGRICKIKGVDLLIRAVRQIPTPTIELSIYGKVTEQDYYEECLKLCDNHKNIYWKGTINPNDVINTIQNYDVLCVPSIVSEMGPLVIQEAFAARIPVVASNVYGNADQIADNKNGWLFNFKDVYDLEKKLQKLINEPSLINKAKLNITIGHGFDKVAHEHQIVYKSLIQNF